MSVSRAAGQGTAHGEGTAPQRTAGLVPGEPVLHYFDHVLPVRPGTAGLPLADLLGAQHYRLTDWHDAAAELNWRRFFEITSLTVAVVGILSGSLSPRFITLAGRLAFARSRSAQAS